MEFISGRCPKCGGQIQIPEDRETILCMYCGAEISCKEAVEALQKPLDQTVTGATVEDCVHALDSLFYGLDNPMEHFKKNVYEPFFKEYLYQHANDLSILERGYLASEDRASFMESVAEPLVSKVEESLKGLRGRVKDDKQLDANLCMVVYVFPALLENNTHSAQAWIDTIIAVWKKHFPKVELHATTYDQINSGFKYRFCFITTAVCETQNKSDNCYELTTLREFRDQYLLQSSEGEALVEEYYDIAPTIVKHINKNERAKEIYDGIYEEYLKPCIRMIEEDQNEECCKLYRDMVYDLKEKYFS